LHSVKLRNVSEKFTVKLLLNAPPIINVPLVIFYRKRQFRVFSGVVGKEAPAQIENFFTQYTLFFTPVTYINS
jgi:hypothetical protein